MTHTPARTRYAALALAVLSTPALVALTPAAQAAVTGSATVSATYGCSVPLIGAFDLPVEFALTAAPDGSATRITASGGRPTLPLDSAVTLTNVSSTLRATVDGAAVTLKSSVPSLTATPNVPLDLPALTGTANPTGSTLAFTPGAFSMQLTYSGFPVTITCSLNGTAPTVTLGSTVPRPPAPQPPAVGKPTLTASLTKKVQKVGGKPATVKVRLARTSSAHAQPAGTVTVKVGKRKLTKRSVTAGTSFSVKVPKNLKKGRHTVTVSFSPTAAARAAGVRATSTRVVLRVKR